MTKETTTDIRTIVSKLDPASRKILSAAADYAYERNHATLDIEHLLLAIFKCEDDPLIHLLKASSFDFRIACDEIAVFLKSLGNDYTLPPTLSARLFNVLAEAFRQLTAKDEVNGGQVSVKHLLSTIIASDDIFSSICENIPYVSNLREVFLQIEEDDKTEVSSTPSASSALVKFTVDLTAKASDGAIDPVIGRDSEIAATIEILLRRRQNNPILTGDAGVGKTAVVEGLAQRIAKGQVPAALLNTRLCSLDMGLVRAGASMRGEVESRIKSIISEVNASVVPIVLFIDEAHTLVAGGSSSGEQNDIANLIKPELARGTLRTIAATTWTEYKRYFEKDAALTRRFQTVRVLEPTQTVAVDILQALVPSLQKHHGVYITQSAVDAAVRLSTRYIQGRQLPDKAISVLDTACARRVSGMSGASTERLRLLTRKNLLSERLTACERELNWPGSSVEIRDKVKIDLEGTTDALSKLNDSKDTQSTHGLQCASLNEKTVFVAEDDVASVIADWSGVPSTKMLSDQYAMVTRLEEHLSRRIVGQTDAIRIISNKLRAYTAKLEDPSRPIGVFLLTGPSGVGKTETAHAISETFFGTSDITVVNMSEYQESHTVSKLKGAPAGYVGYGQGGVLTEAIRRQPYGLLLLDEVEKAHSDVLDLFLQIFDKGFIEDSEGVLIDFKNILILMTSNACTEILAAEPSNSTEPREPMTTIESKINAQLLNYFKPEFIGRAQVVPYFGLNEDELMVVTRLKVDAIIQRFYNTYHANLYIQDAVYEHMVSKCVAQTIGARWLEHYISEQILSKVSAYVLGKLASQSKVGDINLVLLGDQHISVSELLDTHTESTLNCPSDNGSKSAFNEVNIFENELSA